MSNYYVTGDDRSIFADLVAEHSNFNRLKDELKAHIDRAIGFEQKINGKGDYLITLKHRASEGAPIKTSLTNVPLNRYIDFFEVPANSDLDKLATSTIKSLLKYLIDQQLTSQDVEIQETDKIKVLRIESSPKLPNGLKLLYRRLSEGVTKDSPKVHTTVLEIPREDISGVFTPTGVPLEIPANSYGLLGPDELAFILTDMIAAGDGTQVLTSSDLVISESPMKEGRQFNVSLRPNHLLNVFNIDVKLTEKLPVIDEG